MVMDEKRIVSWFGCVPYERSVQSREMCEVRNGAMSAETRQESF